jgi:hypothetical protein
MSFVRFRAPLHFGAFIAWYATRKTDETSAKIIISVEKKPAITGWVLLLTNLSAKTNSRP